MIWHRVVSDSLPALYSSISGELAILFAQGIFIATSLHLDSTDSSGNYFHTIWRPIKHFSVDITAMLAI